MAQHTQGPWTDDEAGFLGADGRPVGKPAPGVPLMDEVARVMADRRLMREAPALLEALRGWLSTYDGWSDAELEKRADPATIRRVRHSRAVIAGATGRDHA